MRKAIRQHKATAGAVVLIVLWVPAIALAPADWITIGGALTENEGRVRLILGLAGLLAITVVTGQAQQLIRELRPSSRDTLPELPLPLDVRVAAQQALWTWLGEEPPKISELVGDAKLNAAQEIIAGEWTEETRWQRAKRKFVEEHAAGLANLARRLEPHGLISHADAEKLRQVPTSKDELHDLYDILNAAANRLEGKD
jgi:hypothetical protein